MFEREIRLNGLMFILLKRLLADVDDAQLSVPLIDGGNAPAFTLAHMAVANDYVLKSMGQPRVAPAEWHKRFRPGAPADDRKTPLPSKAELFAVLESSHQQLVAAAANADVERMNQPHGSDFFKGTPVETIGDTVAHLMTTHFAFHIGQISAWRRRQGKSPLF